MNSQERQYFEKLSKQRLDLANALDVPAARGVKRSTINKYADQAHFLYELLQNADDAEATNVRFILEENQLIFAHDGTRHFSISDPDTEDKDTDNGNLGDINAITSIGNSTKTEGNTIGKFGEGFKAAFLYTSMPHIYDPNFRFKIERLIVPDLLDEDHPMRRPEETLFVFPLNHPKKPKEEAYEEISHKLKNLSFPLLFLSHLKHIDFKFQDVSGFYDKKIKEDRQFDETIAEQICLTQNNVDGSPDDNLWLFSRKDESKLRYSVGYFLNKEGKLRSINKPAFCFFQTKESTGLNFIIHAPFKLTDSRESIPAGESHNDTMLQNLANLSADALVYLRDIGQEKNIRLIDDDIFKIIPINKENFNDPSDKNQVSFLPFFEAIKKKFETDRLLPASDGYVSKKNAYWASAKNIPDVFSNEQLGDLVENKDAKWVFVSRGYTETLRHPILYKYLKYFVEDRCINDDWMIKHIQGRFIEKQSHEWIHKFYKWLSDSNTKTCSSKYKPFFLDQNGNAVAAFDESDQLILFLPSDDMSGYTVIHPELLKNEDTSNFITTKIGVKKPSRIDYIREFIYPKYENSGRMDTNPDFILFFKYYCECPNDRDLLINLIKNLPFLRTYDRYENSWRNTPSSMYSMYMPTDALKVFLDTKEDARFIAFDDYKKLVGASQEDQLKEFLQKLGVKDKISFITTDKVDLSRSDLPKPHSNWERTYNETNIDGCKEILEHIINNKDEDKSYILWKSLLEVKDLEKLKGVCTYFYYTWKSEPYDSSNARDLKTLPWLINSEGKFVSAKDVTKSTLSEKYDISSIAAQKLLTFLEIKEIKEDNTSALTDQQKEALNIGEMFISAGIPKDRLKEIIEQEKRSNEQQEEPKNAARNRAIMSPNERIESIQQTRSKQGSINKNTRNRLREYYTENHMMKCQICRTKMPFDLPNNHGPYFECVELFADLPEYLALCPTCAAKYQIFVKPNEDMCQKLRNKFDISMPQSYVDITLGTENATIYFTNEHWSYIRLFLQLAEW